MQREGSLFNGHRVLVLHDAKDSGDDRHNIVNISNTAKLLSEAWLKC